MKTDPSITVLLAPLIFGLAAWVLSALSGFSRKKRDLYLPLSWCACALALWFPLYSIHRWVRLGDTSAILDCARAYLIGASVLLAVNFLLTFLGLLKNRRK